MDDTERLGIKQFSKQRKSHFERIDQSDLFTPLQLNQSQLRKVCLLTMEFGVECVTLFLLDLGKYFNQIVI